MPCLPSQARHLLILILWPYDVGSLFDYLSERNSFNVDTMSRSRVRHNVAAHDRISTAVRFASYSFGEQSNLKIVSDRRWRLSPFTNITARPPTVVDAQE
jgi:hypothetical protein